MLSKVSILLDSIADSLEDLGRVKEAYDLDLLSNYLDASDHEAFLEGLFKPNISQAVKGLYDLFRDSFNPLENRFKNEGKHIDFVREVAKNADDLRQVVKQYHGKDDFFNKFVNMVRKALPPQPMAIQPAYERVAQEKIEGAFDTDDTKLHSNYIKDHKNCPVCGEHYEMTCKCRIGDKGCPNQHHWHTCPIHKKVYIGVDSHAMGCLKMDSNGLMSKCVCPSY